MSLTDVLGGRWDERLGVVLSVVFLVMANIPGTIALRYALMLALLLIVVVSRRDSLPLLWRESRWPSLLLAVFIGYAAVHCWLLAYWPDYAWSEWKAQLMTGGLWFVIGWGVFRRRGGLSILDRVIVGGTLLALTELVLEAWQWHLTGAWPFMVTFSTATHLEFTFIMNLVLAFVFVALFFSRSQHLPHSRLPAWLLALIAVLIVFVSVRAGARNGMIGLIYLSLSLTFVYLLFERKRLGVKRIVAVALLVPLALGGLGAYAVKKDTRNQVLIGSLEAGWNYQNSTAWFDYGTLPMLADGRQADDSAYKRLAWFHRGLNLMAERPIGFGYGRGAFGRALQHEGYVIRILSHSHSGFIDLGVGLGVPAILLWFAFCWALIVIGYRAFALRDELLGLILVLVSCGFIGRMMIESIQRDHMLYLFLFISAGLLAEIAAGRDVRPA